jgi:hypothetical protein
MRFTLILRALVFTNVAFLVSSCAVTEDALKASSETLHNTSEASSDFTSSTSHKDDQTKPRDVKQFSENNLQRLRENMAVGSGPHLASLADLLGVPVARRPAFYRLTKDQYANLFTSDSTSATEMLVRLESQLEQHTDIRN